MPVIAYLDNSFCAINKEYLRLGEGEVFGCHDPAKATCFDSKEDALNTLDKIFYRIEDVKFAENPQLDIDEFASWINSGTVYRSFKSLHPLCRKYNGEDKEAVLEWHLRTAPLSYSEMRYEVSKTWPELYSLYRHLYKVSVWRKEETGEVSLSFDMSVSRESDIDTFKAELALAMSHITKLDKEGNAIIRVFEHTLSRNGPIYAAVKPDMSHFEIGSQFCPSEFDTIEEFFEYWRSTHYYD